MEIHQRLLCGILSDCGARTRNKPSNAYYERH
jgi:hypothetical protein